MRLYMLPRRGKFKEEMREDRKRAFRQWGEIANKDENAGRGYSGSGSKRDSPKVFWL